MSEEQENKILMFVRAFYNTENIIKRLEYCHAISTSLNKKTMTKVEKQIKDVKGIKEDIENLLKDTKLMRQIRFRYSMSDSSESVLYFGRDFGEEDAYKWLEGVENHISQINVFLLQFVNTVLKELEFEEEISLNY